MAFDQLGALWSRYQVWKVDWKIRSYNGVGTPYIAGQIRPSQSTISIAGSDYSTVTERSGGCAKILTSNADDDVIYGSFTINEIEGSNTYDTNYTGGTGGNPTNLATLLVGCGDAGDADGASLDYNITLTYHVRFFMPVLLQQS